MIASPCKLCPNIDLPKDYCIENCPLIQELQAQAAAHLPLVPMAVDYTDFTESGITGIPASLISC